MLQINGLGCLLLFLGFHESGCHNLVMRVVPCSLRSTLISGFWGNMLPKISRPKSSLSKHGDDGFLSKVGVHLQVNTTSHRKTVQFEYILKYYKHAEGTFVTQTPLDRGGP